MRKTQKRVLLVLVCVISFLLFAVSENTDQPVNHTRGNNPILEFRTHMLRAISTLSVSRQCTILTAILKDSGENPSRVMKEFMDTVPYQHLPCVPTSSPSESPVNISGLQRATDYYVTRLFNNLPHVFQCKVISDVTFATRGDVTKEALKEALTETVSKISKELKLENMAKYCTYTKPMKIITNTRVQIGVRLRKTMPFEAWLERFKKILPKIYLTYVSKLGRVSEFVTDWTTNDEGAKIPVIPSNQFLVKIQEEPITDANVAMVSFSLFFRTMSGDYRLISGDEVVASLERIRRSILNSYIQAEVIAWRSHGDRHNIRLQRMRNPKAKPNGLETFRLQNSFPKYLVKFFKSLASDGRCYILRQISSYVELDLLVVEKHYHDLGMLPKKYYCSRAAKYESRLKNKRPRPFASVWERLDRFIQTISTSTPTMSTTISKAQTNSTIIRETRPFNSMEIVMFALLCFLCLLIMVFVANCVVFTFKTKQLSSKYSDDFQTPQVVFGHTEEEDYGIKPEEHSPGEITLTDNPQLAVARLPGGGKAGNLPWRLLSVTSEGAETVTSDVISLSDDEPERVSAV